MINNLLDEPYWIELEEVLKNSNVSVKKASFNSIVNYLINKNLGEFEKFNHIFPNSIDMVLLSSPDFFKMRVDLIQKIRAYILLKCQRQKGNVPLSQSSFIEIIKLMEEFLIKENNLELLFKILVVARASHSRITCQSELTKYIQYVLKSSNYLS